MATRKTRVPRKRQAKSSGLEPKDCLLEIGRELEPLAARVAAEGGVIIGAYKDPLGGHALVLAILPLDRVQPTPYQRDLSDAHHKRLSGVIQKTGRFLDPVIGVLAPGTGVWTPNGLHRLEAMRRLGAKSITVLLLPDHEVAWQILALNTEKAHNLKERSHEVIRIFRSLMEESGSKPESDYEFYLEDPSLVTLGLAYEQKRSFGGGAYHPVLRRVEAFSDQPLRAALKTHERRAALLLELDERVGDAVARLKERGLQSPYLRAFVVARINPLRFIKGELPAPEKLLENMRDRAAKFNAAKVEQKDLSGGFAPVADED